MSQQYLAYRLRFIELVKLITALNSLFIENLNRTSDSDRERDFRKVYMIELSRLVNDLNSCIDECSALIEIL